MGQMRDRETRVTVRQGQRENGGRARGQKYRGAEKRE